METEEIDIVYWERFYENNVKGQIEEKGEAYIEWLTCKNSLVKQLNYLRFKYKLKITWFEKECNKDWTCIFIKPA
jgi:hypothetical protein